VPPEQPIQHLEPLQCNAMQCRRQAWRGSEQID
jgi:hypothetical protein